MHRKMGTFFVCFVTFTSTLVFSVVWNQLRELGVAVVGNARKIRGGPPKDIKNISNSQFNTLHWINDERKFQIQQCIDNNIVTMIMTLHTPEDTIRRIQKNHRVKQADNNHMDFVWGT